MGLKRSARTYGARAVVTGAGSGIGRAFSEELARRLGLVVCADINVDAALETVELVERRGGKAIAVECDVTDLDSFEALAAEAQGWFGLPNLVINNAGIGGGGKQIGEGALDDWHKILEVNLWGVINGSHVFVPLLRDAGAAGIINVASAAGFAAAPGMAAYNVSKAAVMSLSETLAAELAGTEVRVTTLCPTFVPTNIFDNPLISPDSARVARAQAEKNGSTARSVALDALKGLDAGRLYVMPQTDAKLVWRAKRLIPGLYPKLAAKAVARESAAS